MEPSNKPVGEGFGRKVAVGSFWTMLSRFGVRGIGFVSTIILARLLVPEDFGLVAMAMIVAGGIEAMSEIGISTFLITKQHSDDRHYNTAWTMNVIRSAILAAILALLAPWVAAFFDEPDLIFILYFISLGTFIQGFENVGVVNFQKEFQFSKDFKWMVSTKLIGFVVTITVAWFLRNYWALVAGTLAARGARVTLSFLMHSYRPRFSLSEWREVFRFSKWLIMFNALGFLRNQGDRFVLGKLASVNAMGIYTIAWEIANLPTSELMAPIRRALLPAFSALANDQDALRKAYLDTTEIIIFLVSPVAVGLILVADLAIPILLGEKWMVAAPIVQILVVGGLLQAWTAPAGTVFLALGQPKIVVVLNAVSAAILFPAAIMGGMKYGVSGIAWAVVLAAAVLALCSQIYIFLTIGVSIRAIVKKAWRTIISLGAMALTVSVIEFIPGNQNSEIVISLIVKILIGVFSYSVINLLLWNFTGRVVGPEEKTLKFLIKTIEKYAKPFKE